jgi:hypothetical protein
MRHMLLVFSILAAACSGDDGGDGTADVDAGLPIDAPGCDVTAALPANYRPIAMVSSGTVAVTASGGVTSGTVDGTAGGLAGAPDNPYIYVDLVNGTRVDVSDLGARQSTAWHVAFKRSSILVNGGDSGPGGVTAAAVPAATLAEVTAVPAALNTDDWATDDCMLNTTPGGEPLSAFGEWYDYNPDTHQLSPRAEVWVLKLGSGDGAPVRKLRITTYYGDTAMPMRGAYYGVEWAAL